MEISNHSNKAEESQLPGDATRHQSQPDLEAASTVPELPQTNAERSRSIGGKGGRKDEIIAESEDVESPGLALSNLSSNAAESADPPDPKTVRRRIRFANPWRPPKESSIATEDDPQSPRDVSAVTRHERTFDTTQNLRRTGTGMTEINLPYLSFTASISRNSVGLSQTYADYRTSLI